GGGKAGGATDIEESTVSGPASDVVARCDFGRNRPHTMNRTINTAAAVIIPESRRSTMRAICEHPMPRRYLCTLHVPLLVARMCLHRRSSRYPPSHSCV